MAQTLSDGERAAQLALPADERLARLEAVARKLAAKREARKRKEWLNYLAYLQKKAKRREKRHATPPSKPEEF